MGYYLNVIFEEKFFIKFSSFEADIWSHSKRNYFKKHSVEIEKNEFISFDCSIAGAFISKQNQCNKKFSRFGFGPFRE